MEGRDGLNLAPRGTGQWHRKWTNDYNLVVFTFDGKVNGMLVDAVSIADLQFVHLTVARVRSLDPKGGYVAVVTLPCGQWPGRLGHKPAMARPSCQDNLVTLGSGHPHVPEVPRLVGDGVGAELNLQNGLGSDTHYQMLLSCVTHHLGSSRNLVEKRFYEYTFICFSLNELKHELA